MFKSMGSCLILLVLAFLQIQLHCTAAAAIGNSRVRRGTGKLNIGTTAKDYMAQIGAVYADKDGKPKDLSSAPTSVWCFLDKAVVNEEYRAKPTGEGGKCRSISRFVFNWEQVANITHMTLNRSILRPYVKTIDRLIELEQIIPVNVSVSLRLLHKDMTVDAASSSDYHFVQTFNMVGKADGWLELDITSAILAVWTPYSIQPPVIEVTLKMQVDCFDHKKVPFNFVNPAEVDPELSEESRKRRVKQTALQPLLVVFLEDRLVKDKLAIEANEEKRLTMPENMIAVNETASRQRRSAVPNLCRKEPYTVNFTELHLDYIILPQVINISKCAGSCSDYLIAPHPTIATNHARIKATAKVLYDHRLFRNPNSTMYYSTHKDPCCVPVEYESRYLTLEYIGSYHSQLFPEIVAKTCRCR